MTKPPTSPAPDPARTAQATAFDVDHESIQRAEIIKELKAAALASDKAAAVAILDKDPEAHDHHTDLARSYRRAIALLNPKPSA